MKIVGTALAHASATDPAPARLIAIVAADHTAPILLQ